MRSLEYLSVSASKNSLLILRQSTGHISLHCAQKQQRETYIFIFFSFSLYSIAPQGHTLMQSLQPIHLSLSYWIFLRNPSGVSIGEIILALPVLTSARNLVVEEGRYFAGNLLVNGFLNICANT
jgi:hypothetical protein